MHSEKRPIYLDNHSTTPVDSRVLDAMLPFFTNDFGNPSSKNHSYGWKADFAVENAREQVAKALNATSHEIIFTSGATEANNLAIFGLAEYLVNQTASKTSCGHIISSTIEHKSILDTLKYLKDGKKCTPCNYEITLLPVNKYGQVNPEDLEKAIRPNTFLISIMLANNEVGTINPLKKISAIARKHEIFLHTDAAQAVGKIPINVDDLGIDMLSLSAHKLYGPKGVGALYLRRKNPRVEIAPIFHGGGQEKGIRSGTLNVPGIVGLGAACEIAQNEMNAESARILELRKFLEESLLKIHGAAVNGHPTERLPGNLNISFPYIESDALVARLKNIAVSSSSACLSNAGEVSYVLCQMGVKQELIHGNIRLGLGRQTTREEIDDTIRAIVENVNLLQAASPLFQLEGFKNGREPK